MTEISIAKNSPEAEAKAINDRIQYCNFILQHLSLNCFSHEYGSMSGGKMQGVTVNIPLL